MTAPDNPFVLRQRLATTLRDARNQTGLTIEQVSAELYCSTAKISRIETGKRAASPRDVRDLSRLYGMPEDVQKQLIDMAMRSRHRGWWEDHDLAPAYASYAALEAIAAKIRDFKSSIVPGLLQTPGYAQAVIESYFDPVDPAVLEGLMRARRQRQLGLFGEGSQTPELHIIMDEAALHRLVGGPAVMVAQLDRILEDSEEFGITVQVLPFSAGAHAGVETTFSILTFDDPALGTAAFAEDIFGMMQLTRGEDLAKCERIFGLVEKAALPPGPSLDLIRSVRDTLRARTADGHTGAEAADDAG